MSGLESLDTCSQPGEAGWEIVRSLGQLASQGRVGPTDPLRLILASHLNTALLPLVSGLPMVSLLQDMTDMAAAGGEAAAAGDMAAAAGDMAMMGKSTLSSIYNLHSPIPSFD